jgi:hypothetical protein
MRGNPVDHRALDRHGAEHGEQGAQGASGLEAAVGEEPVKAHRDAEPRQGVGDRQHDKVLPVKAAAPSVPRGHAERGERQADDRCLHDALASLVLDRNQFGGPRRGGRGGGRHLT